jgi:hypothetical protein
MTRYTTWQKRVLDRATSATRGAADVCRPGLLWARMSASVSVNVCEVVPSWTLHKVSSAVCTMAVVGVLESRTLAGNDSGGGVVSEGRIKNGM